MKPVVSAVITTFGRPFTVLDRSIRSVLEQTLKNVEIIVVDDNDPDSDFRPDLEKGLAHYPFIRHVKHDRNKGAQVSRNDGILSSTGDFIAFLDDDDEWLPEKLEKQLALVCDDVGLIYCKGLTVIEGSKGSVTENYANTKNFAPEVTFDDLLFSDCIGTTTQAMIPKHVFYKCGMFDINQPARQDYEMWIRISQKYRCVGVPEVLFKHYIHESEQISRNPQKALAGYWGIYHKHQKGYRKRPAAHWHLLISIRKEYIKGKRMLHAFLFSFLISFYFIVSLVTDRKFLLKKMKQYLNG